MKRPLTLTAAALALLAPPARAADDTATSTSIDIDVIAQQLDAARSQIQPSLGASRFDFDQQQLQDIPQGQNAPLNQVLLQAPGVAEDSFGQIHIRGDHANVQYRLDGVQLPEGLSGFGQALESRFAHSLSLITGALPAQYGFLQAGVVDIVTKSGTTDPGAELSMYGGSRGYLQPSGSWGGRSGAWDWYITGDFLQNPVGIENPTALFSPIHDDSNQAHGFAHISAIIDDQTRISVLAGAYGGYFQIPNNPGQAPVYTVNGASDFDSAALNERQRENTQFAILSLQKHTDAIDVQAAAFTRTTGLYFSPDPLGDLIFNGLSQTANRTDWATGVQLDSSWRVAEAHTLRAGFLVQGERVGSNTASQVLPADGTGQTSDQPFFVYDGSGRTGALYGLYVQDEFRATEKLTLNFGLRFDAVNEYTSENQVSPRINLVYKPLEGTTLHAGYARYFTPPPFELVAPTSVNLFANTTAAPAVTQDDTVKAERAHYFDLGVSQVVLPGLTLGVDSYYKLATNLIDEGQFGAPIILSAFNYAQGEVGGVELTASYDHGPWSLYANLAFSRAIGRDIVSAQFNFAPDELAYIAQHWIHLDHDQTLTGSAGAAYTLFQGTPEPLRLSGTITAGSGLRASTPTIPNGASLPGYAAVNLSAVQTLNLGIGAATELRLDVLNLFDRVYEIRDGTGVGVGAPQYGLRRTILAGLAQRF